MADLQSGAAEVVPEGIGSHLRKSDVQNGQGQHQFRKGPQIGIPTARVHAFVAELLELRGSCWARLHDTVREISRGLDVRPQARWNRHRRARGSVCVCGGVVVPTTFHIGFHGCEFGLVFRSMQDTLKDFQTGPRPPFVSLLVHHQDIEWILVVFRHRKVDGRFGRRDSAASSAGPQESGVVAARRVHQGRVVGFRCG